MVLAPGRRGDVGDDFQAFGVEHVVGLEVVLLGLFEGDDGDFLEGQTVGLEALLDVGLDLLREDVAVLVQLRQRLSRGIAPERADHLGFEQKDLDTQLRRSRFLSFSISVCSTAMRWSSM